MATFTQGRLYVGAYALAAYVQGLTPPRDEPDVKRYSTLADGGWQRAAAGLSAGSAAYDLLVETDTVEIKSQEIVQAAWKVADVPLSAVIGAGAAGDPAFFLRALHVGYKPGAVVGDLLVAKIDIVASQGPVVYGSVLDIGVKNATGNGSAVELGAVSATQRIWAVLHVLACAGGTLTVKVQSDTVGFPSPTDRLTFAAVTAPGSEWKDAAGPITDTYWRASWTLTGGSATFALVAGIR